MLVKYIDKSYSNMDTAVGYFEIEILHSNPRAFLAQW